MAARRGGHRAGDWSVRSPGLEPGGWAFEFANVNYPDVDDTVEVVLALQRLVGQQPIAAGVDGAVGRALRWVEGMQSSGGGWGAFDADNTRALVRELPFLDFGEVIDEPSADVTAHAVEMLGVLGLAETPAARRGVHWLIDHQEPDGSWFGRWGINHVYGTGAAVPGLIAAGIESSQACIRRAVDWLERHQNEDGGWGEDPRSYDEPEWIGRGPSTASQTAWALLALHAAGERSQALARGIAWLVSTQRADGGWDEPQYTGTGFPSDYYINYHLYRLTFPIMALGRCLATDAGRVARAPRHPRRARPATPSDWSDADSRRADRRPRRGGGHGAGGGRELPRRQPRAAASRARSPAGRVRLRPARRRARRQRQRPAGERLAALDWLEAELERAFRGEAEHPLLVRLTGTLRECSLTRQPFVRLIEANRVDQRVSRYQTWTQLHGYCALSADPVGELVLAVFGLASPARIALSDSICTALQLTEHCQDVAEDLARGRVYLPPEDLRRFGCSETDLAGEHASEALREVLAFEVARARGLLADGLPLVAQLRGRPRLAVAAFLAGGRAALDAIERARYDVLAGPPRAGRVRRALALAGTLRSARGAGS